MKDLLVLVVFGLLVAAEAQYGRRTRGRGLALGRGRRRPGILGTPLGSCPNPRTLICRTGCTPGNRPCEFGRLCCKNACGGFDCADPVGPSGVPSWCPPGSPRIRCLVNPCNPTVNTCPRYPQATCINDNPCEPACSGSFYLYSRKLSYNECNY